MTVSIVAKNTAQGLSKGQLVSTGVETMPNIVVTLHEVPAGRRQKIQIRLTIRVMSTLQRVRIRLGALAEIIFEDGTGKVIPPAETTDLGTYVMNAGEKLSYGSGSPATEGATFILNASILEDVPE